MIKLIRVCEAEFLTNFWEVRSKLNDYCCDKATDELDYKIFDFSFEFSGFEV